VSRRDLGVGDILVSGTAGDEIRTYGLGSCVALVVWDWDRHAGGMIHVALPDSAVNPAKASAQPGSFADSGLPVLFRRLDEAGVRPASSWIKLVGGASILDPDNLFDIGGLNVRAVEAYLQGAGLALTARDTGGTLSRTLNLSVSTGVLTVSSGSRTWLV